jgi:hypothetical protein
MVLSVNLHISADLGAVPAEQRGERAPKYVWNCPEEKNLLPFAGDQALAQNVHSVPR